MEILVQPHEEHHGKFQTLALVDGHQPHQVFIFPQDLGAFRVLAHAHFPHDLQKAAEGHAAPVLKFRRLLAQQHEIGLPGFPFRQTAADGEHARLPHEIPEEIRQLHRAGTKPPLLQGFPNAPATRR